MRKHPTIPDLYVTDEGRVFLELGVRPSYGGYHMCHGKGVNNVRRHVLVCETFHGPRPEKGVVRHRNGKAGDDRPENLEWGNQAQNCADTVAHGKSTAGQRNAQAKITELDVLEIRRRWAAGEGPTALADEYGLKQPSIQDIVRGRTWSHLPLTSRN